MTIRFATWADKGELNRICNHPEVRKWTHISDRPFDIEPFLKRPHNIAIDAGGCFISPHLGGLFYGVHTNIVPEGRSAKKTLTFATEALMLGFLGTPAETYLTQVASSNKAAEWLVRQMGFRYVFTRPGAWGGNDLHYWRLDIDDWILRGNLRPLGVGFHEELERLGMGPDHPPDPIHDCYVGALIALIGAGKAEKGLRVYNRWAAVVGYVQLKMLSQSPLLIDAGTFLVDGADGELKVKLKEKTHAD